LFAKKTSFIGSATAGWFGFCYFTTAASKNELCLLQKCSKVAYKLRESGISRIPPIA